MADRLDSPRPVLLSRRALLGVGAVSAALRPARAQQPSEIPPYQPRDWWGDPIGYPDPDIIALDPRFRRYMLFNTPIKRHYVGTLWAEGPAWNGVGRYLVWSDIPNDRQLRWIEDDDRVTVFRRPSGHSNGNTFDHQGRQLSCEHGGRRVVRYEYNGEVTVIAESFEGKRLNSPNDIVVHRDGGIWFTDPPTVSAVAMRASRPRQSCRTPSIGSTRLPAVSARSPTRSALRTGCASRRSTTGCMWPTPGRVETSSCGTSMGRRCGTDGFTRG